MNFFLTLLIVLISNPAFSHEFEAGNITVHHPYAYAIKAGEDAASVFMTITNDGEEADRLLSASTPAATGVEIHDGEETLQGVDVASHESKRFKPDGIHIVLNGVKGPIKIGQHKPLTLVFEKAGKVTTQILFSKPGEVSHCDDKHHH